MPTNKFNIGCGSRDFGEGWVHIDGGDYPHLDGRDIFLTDYENESADLIYASHLIEYFDSEEVMKLLVEWRRVLRGGGILRLSVPNFEELCYLYMSGTCKIKRLIGPLYGRMKMGDEFIYHKMTYDWRSLFDLLTECGFRDIRGWDWKYTDHAQYDDFSQAYIPHMDKHNGILISLNMEGIK